jgi:hypothetical protein
LRIATTHNTVKVGIPTTGAELLRTPTNMPGHYSYTFMAQSTHTTIAFEEIVATNSTILLCNFTLLEVGGGYAFGGAGGQQKDDEIFIGAYTAEFWEYDSRLGRRWNVDPITYPWQSSYAVFNNCPLVFIDPLGLSGEGTNDPPKDPKEGDKHMRTDKNGNKFEYEYKNGKWEGTGGTGSLPEVVVTPPSPAPTPPAIPRDNTTTNYPEIVIGAGGEFKLPHVPDMVGIIVEAYDNAQAFRNAALNTNQFKQLGKGHVSHILTTYSLVENVYNKEYLNAAVDGISLAVSVTKYNPYYSVGMTILQITNSDIVKSRIARDNYIIHRKYVQLSIRLENLGDKKGAEFYSKKATEIERKMQDEWYNSIRKNNRK